MKNDVLKLYRSNQPITVKLAITSFIHCSEKISTKTDTNQIIGPLNFYSPVEFKVYPIENDANHKMTQNAAALCLRRRHMQHFLRLFATRKLTYNGRSIATEFFSKRVS